MLICWKKIRQGLSEEFGYSGEQVHLTGMLVLYNNMLQSLFESQILTLGMVLAGNHRDVSGAVQVMETGPDWHYSKYSCGAISAGTDGVAGNTSGYDDDHYSGNLCGYWRR